MVSIDRFSVWRVLGVISSVGSCGYGVESRMLIRGSIKNVSVSFVII